MVHRHGHCPVTQIHEWIMPPLLSTFASLYDPCMIIVHLMMNIESLEYPFLSKLINSCNSRVRTEHRAAFINV